MFKPINDNVIIKAIDAQDITHGGVIIPDTSQEATMQAKVVAVGPGLFTQTGDRIPMTCKSGGTVLLHSRLLKGDNTVTFEDEKYTLVRESEIAMVSN